MEHSNKLPRSYVLFSSSLGSLYTPGVLTSTLPGEGLRPPGSYPLSILDSAFSYLSGLLRFKQKRLSRFRMCPGRTFYQVISQFPIYDAYEGSLYVNHARLRASVPFLVSLTY